jgi:hypothetical protein
VDADPWSVLGLDPSATYEEARQAYRRRSRLLHPDRHPDADAELRQEAERAMVALNHAWEAIESILKGGAQRPSNAGRASQSNNDARTSRDRPGEHQADDDSDDFGTPEECLEWVLGALIEGGKLQGDPLSSAEITRALRPISKEVGKSSFDVWLAHRTNSMRAALDADRTADQVTSDWLFCYECLNNAQSDKVIMMMLDELLDDGQED